MRIIAKKALKDYWEREPAARAALEAWHAEAKNADWTTPADVKASYGTASILKDGRVVFNIGGNKYRLVVSALSEKTYVTQTDQRRKFGAHPGGWQRRHQSPENKGTAAIGFPVATCKPACPLELRDEIRRDQAWPPMCSYFRVAPVSPMIHLLLTWAL